VFNYNGLFMDKGTTNKTFCGFREKVYLELYVNNKQKLAE